MKGQLHSIETLGGLDGPGMRCVVFLQGCPMRCLYCHNPETWNAAGGERIDSAELVRRVLRCRPYFGADGGVTLSGGEPLMQAAFVAEVLEGCRAAGVHTAVDTNGAFLNDHVERALRSTDLVILDIKHTDPARHLELTGGELGHTLAFLDYVTFSDIPLWVRQVVVPGFNDTQRDVLRLAELLRGRGNLQKVELLPYHKMAAGKWQALGLANGLADTPEPSPERIEELRATLTAALAPAAR